MLEVSLDDMTVYSTDGTEYWDMNAEGAPLTNSRDLMGFVEELEDAGYIDAERLEQLLVDIRAASMWKHPYPSRIIV